MTALASRPADARLNGVVVLSRCPAWSMNVSRYPAASSMNVSRRLAALSLIHERSNCAAYGLKYRWALEGRSKWRSSSLPVHHNGSPRRAGWVIEVRDVMRSSSMTPFGTRHPRRLLAGVLSFAIAVLGALVYVLPAQAQPTHHPKGVFAPFAYCPFNDPELDLCQVSITLGGELRIGRMVVPITKSSVGVRGAWNGPPESLLGVTLTYAPPEEGGTMQRMPQPVPGGLAGVIEPASLPASLRAVFDALVGAGLGGLTETIEVAGPPSSVKLNFENTLGEKGVVLEEPVRVKLTNPFLGESCFIGSLANPIQIVTTEELTTPPPPNKPIKGNAGNVGILANAIFAVAGNSLVDNSFALPAATGCGGSLAPLVDRAINAKLGLPSPPGRNTVVINSRLELTLPKNVLANE
jgi:hypothetical protein